MYCIKCGKKISDDSIFCPYCGNKCPQLFDEPVTEAAVPVINPNEEKEKVETVVVEKITPVKTVEQKKSNNSPSMKFKVIAILLIVACIGIPYFAITKSVNTHYQKGLQFYAEKEYEKAIEEFKQAKDNGEYPHEIYEAYYDMAIEFEQSGDLLSAMKAYYEGLKWCAPRLFSGPRPFVGAERDPYYYDSIIIGYLNDYFILQEAYDDACTVAVELENQGRYQEALDIYSYCKEEIFVPYLDEAYMKQDEIQDTFESYSLVIKIHELYESPYASDYMGLCLHMEKLENLIANQ